MPILSELLLVLLFSAVALFLCHKLRIPPIIGYLVTGLLLGPSALAMITQGEMVDTLANIGVILLMFSVGLEFSLGELARMGMRVVLGMVVQMGFTILAVAGVLAAFGVAPGTGIFFGFLIGASSTAIILKSLQEAAQMEAPHGRLSVSISVSQDMVMIMMVLLTPLLAGSAEGDVLGDMGMLLLTAVLTIAGTVVAARYIAPAILMQVARTRDRELFLFVIVILCFAVAWLVSAVGLSLALGAFLAGLIVSESEFSHQALGNILPFKDLFSSIFFVSIGMLLDIAVFTSQPLLVLSIALAIIVGKSVLAGVAVRLLRYPLRTAVLAGVALIPIGEFSFILSLAGLQAGLLGRGDYQVFLAASIFSMAATPVLIALAPRFADRLGRAANRRTESNTPSTIAEEHGMLIIGYGLNGSNLARAARRAGIPYQVVEMNPSTVRREAKAGVNIMFGDATQDAVLHSAGIGSARVVVIAISDAAATERITARARVLNGTASIIVRTRFVSEVERLRAAGADEVIPEEFETALEIFTRALRRFLLPRRDIDRMVEELRSGGYDALREHAPMPVPTLAIPEYDITAVEVEEHSPAVGRSLRELELRPRYSVTVLGQRHGGTVHGAPDPDRPLRAGELLILLGTPEDITSAASELFESTGD
ncbi:MAG TPA: cation:proton antiporter [Bacteroidota bacterium]|nr:cation:proton antiporter [Bacteroidota bacterium]